MWFHFARKEHNLGDGRVLLASVETLARGEEYEKLFLDT